MYGFQILLLYRDLSDGVSSIPDPTPAHESSSKMSAHYPLIHKVNSRVSAFSPRCWKENSFGTSYCSYKIQIDVDNHCSHGIRHKEDVVSSSNYDIPYLTVSVFLSLFAASAIVKIIQTTLSLRYCCQTQHFSII